MHVHNTVIVANQEHTKAQPEHSRQAPEEEHMYNVMAKRGGDQDMTYRMQGA